MTRHLEIATAVANTIDAAGFAWADTPEVGFRIRRDLENIPGPLALMAIAVQPGGMLVERLGRPGSVSQYDHEIAVDFLRKTDVQNDNTDPTLIGTMVGWVELATAYLLNNPLVGDAASLIGVEVDSPFDAEAFDVSNVFLARVVFTFRDTR